MAENMFFQRNDYFLKNNMVNGRNNTILNFLTKNVLIDRKSILFQMHFAWRAEL